MQKGRMKGNASRGAELAFGSFGIKTMEDLSVIPVTIKEDLQQRNEDFLCVPRSTINHLHPACQYRVPIRFV